MTFPPNEAGAAAWRAQVEQELRGADYERALVRWTLDELEQEPVYARAADPERLGQPGTAPFRRGSQAPSGQSRPWRICSRIDAASPEQANAEALEDLRGGVDALWLVADRTTRLAGAGGASDEPTQDLLGQAGIDLGGKQAWGRLLQGVQAELLALHLDAGAVAPTVAMELLDELAARGVAAECEVHVGVDPLAALALDGALPCSLEAARAAAWPLLARADEFPRCRIFRADGLVAHAAGASEAWELGVILGSLTETLRAADAAGQDLDLVLARTDLRVGVAQEVFLEVAKIRALRELWTRVAEACEVDPVPAPYVHAVASPRTMTRVDPWTNLLRSTTQGFAAAVAGADAITLLPMDAAFQRPGSLGRRMARNTQLVLAEEGHLGEIVDPAGGSFAIEAWTDDLVEAGWAAFQEIEAQGGLTSALRSGWLGDRLADLRERRHQAVATRRAPITGVSEYAQLEARVPDAGVESTADENSWQHGEGVPGRWVEMLGGLPSGEPAQADPWPAMRDAAGFEALRAAAETYRAEVGHAPRVCLATLGTLAQHNARSTFASNFFAAGGFESIMLESAGPGEAQGAVAVCICGTDEAYEEFAPEVVMGLKNAGASRVLLAGKPGALSDDTQQALSEAGLSTSIHLGCDALAVLQDLHRALTEGVQA